MKTTNKPRRGDLLELVGALSLLWALCREQNGGFEEDYSFFEGTAL